MSNKKFDELPEQWVEMREIPFGGLFRLSNSDTAPVWVRDEYDRTMKKYWAYKYDDVCHSKTIKPDTLVWVGFEF